MVKRRQSKKGGSEESSSVEYNRSANYGSSLNNGYGSSLNGTGANYGSNYGRGSRYGGKRSIRGGNVGPYKANDLARHAGSYHGYPTAKAHYVGGKTKKRRTRKR